LHNFFSEILLRVVSEEIVQLYDVRLVTFISFLSFEAKLLHDVVVQKKSKTPALMSAWSTKKSTHQQQQQQDQLSCPSFA